MSAPSGVLGGGNHQVVGDRSCSGIGGAVDPVSMEALAALAGGAGGELGREAWAALTALVRRPRNRTGVDRSGPSGGGESELLRLADAPGDQAAAEALSAALTQRARSDPAFDIDLTQWGQRSAPLTAEWGAVHNSVSGGIFHGPVIQTRDISGLTFNGPSTADAQPRNDPREENGT